MDQIIELVREEEEMKVRRIKLLGLDKFSMLADKYKQDWQDDVSLRTCCGFTITDIIQV